MSDKNIVIKWPKAYRGRWYKVGESSGKFYVSHVTGSFFTSHRSLGTTDSFQIALELIKADVGSGEIEFDVQGC